MACAHARGCFLLRAPPRHPIPSWHVWFLTGFLALVADLKSKHKHNNHETEHLYNDFVKYQSDTNTTTTHICTLADSLLFSIHPRIQCNTNRNKTVPSPITRTSCSILPFALIHHHHHHNNNIAKQWTKQCWGKEKIGFLFFGIK